ncbi:MAG: DUF3152 domain-containing protein [Actinobacteria bacterium]|nr:DUF3152 domain-containing protein [Actinomycetota bacterium]MBI3687789.1 DUF3152 domain-containing protein [Actinomycetota bacterium]
MTRPTSERGGRYDPPPLSRVRGDDRPGTAADRGRQEASRFERAYAERARARVPAGSGARLPDDSGASAGAELGPHPPGRQAASYGVVARGRGRSFELQQQEQQRRGPGPLDRFVERFGWRAYAIPVLVVATFLAGIDIARGDGAGSGRDSRTLTGATRDSEIYVELPAGAPAVDGAMDTLPDGPAYARQGTGTFHVLPGRSKVYGSGPVQRYTVEVEDGITLDGAAFADQVERILGDPRGWGAGGRMSFQRVDDPGLAKFRVSLTSTMTVRRFCGYDVKSETSCYYGAVQRAVINDARWVRGAKAFLGDLTLYRQYVVSHEVGHSFGRRHEMCAGAAGPAPVMMQQTLSVGTCAANPWPFPDGVQEVTGPPAPVNLPVGQPTP